MSGCEYYRSGGACGRTHLQGRCDWLTSQDDCPDFKPVAPTVVRDALMNGRWRKIPLPAPAPIVSMVEFKGQGLVATSERVYKLTDDDTLTPIKFEEEI